MDLAATIVLNGLTLAALYFVVASGFSLVFGLMRVVNMAHGAMYLVAGYRTKLGMMIRAGVDDREMLGACGVNVPLLGIAVFALGAALAGLGGVIGATAQPLAQGVDGRFLLISLVVVIVGGMGSVAGTALGAVLVGLAEQIGQAMFPTYSVILTFVIMVGVLALRPQGILGRG